MGYLVYRFALLLGISPLFVVLESTLGLKLRLRSYSAERFREPRSPSSYLSRMVRYVDTAFLFEASRRVLGGEWRANGTFLDAVVGTLRLGDIAGFWIMGFDGATDALTPTLFVRREFNGFAMGIYLRSLRRPKFKRPLNRDSLMDENGSDGVFNPIHPPYDSFTKLDLSAQLTHLWHRNMNGL